MTITLPKIRLRLSKSASKTKHTLAEMSVAYDCIASQSGLEIYSVEQDCKSVYQKETKTYIIECKGHSWDSTVYGDYEKAWEIWYNSGDLPFTDKAFDLKSAIIDFNIGMYTAIKDFNFELQKTDADYLSLREDFDRCTYINTLTKQQRDGFYKRDYDSMNEIKDARRAMESLADTVKKAKL